MVQFRPGTESTLHHLCVVVLQKPPYFHCFHYDLAACKEPGGAPGAAPLTERLRVRLKINVGFILPGRGAPWRSRWIFFFVPDRVSPFSVRPLIEADRHNAAVRWLRPPGGGAPIAILEGRTLLAVEKMSRYLFSKCNKPYKQQNNEGKNVTEDWHNKYSCGHKMIKMSVWIRLWKDIQFKCQTYSNCHRQHNYMRAAWETVWNSVKEFEGDRLKNHMTIKTINI